MVAHDSYCTGQTFSTEGEGPKASRTSTTTAQVESGFPPEFPLEFCLPSKTPELAMNRWA